MDVIAVKMLNRRFDYILKDDRSIPRASLVGEGNYNDFII